MRYSISLVLTQCILRFFLDLRQKKFGQNDFSTQYLTAVLLYWQFGSFVFSPYISTVYTFVWFYVVWSVVAERSSALDSSSGVARM